MLELDDDVALVAYRLEKTYESGPIPLDANRRSSTRQLQRGKRLTPEQYLRLSELIEAINEKFGLNLTDADMLFIEQVGQDIMADDDLAEKAKANPRDVFKGEFDKEFLGKVLKRKDRNEEMLKMILDSPEFADLIKSQMLPWVYDGLKKRKPTPDLIADGESDTVEFKSTARWNIKAGQKGPEIEDAIVKSVAAFLNSGGGTLLIGVADDGSVGTLEHRPEALRRVFGQVGELAGRVAASRCARQERRLVRQRLHRRDRRRPRRPTRHPAEPAALCGPRPRRTPASSTPASPTAPTS